MVAWNGQVVDNAAMRVRGNTSRAENEVNWKVELPKGRVLDMQPLMPYPLDEFAVQSEAEPLADLGWNTVNGAGARGLTMFPVRAQRNGDFFSVGHIMETEDGTWRDAQGVDKWAIYKGDGGSLGRTSSPAALENTLTAGCPLCAPEPWLNKKTRKDEDFTDVWQLSQVIDAPPSAAQREWIFQNVNVPVMVNYMAINSVMRHADSGWYNWYVARDTEGTGRWEMWHWDLNWIFTTPEADGKGTFLTPDTSNRFTRAMLAYPDITEMFHRRLRTLADEFLLPTGKYEAMWDGIASPYSAEWDLDRAAWGGYSPAGARAAFIQGLQDRYAVIAANSGPGKPVPPSQSAAPNVVINEIQYAPAGGDDAEFIELTNPSATESVDLSDWTVEGIGLTIAPGTVLLPGKQIAFVKSDTAFRAAYPAANRLVGGEYAGDLSDTGETLRLMQGARVVDEVAYSPAAPWPTAAAGTGPSLELASPDADNTLAESWAATSTTGGTPAATNSALTPPPTPVLYADTFTGADGSAWAPAWVTNAASGSATLFGNTGRLLANNSGGAYARALLGGAAEAARTDLVTSFQWNSANPNAYLSIFTRGSGGWLNGYRPRNGYGLELTANSSTVTMKRVVNGTTTNLASTGGAQQVGGGKQWLRLRADGTTIQYRIWPDGTAEPPTWNATVTDANVTAPGQVFLSLVRSGSATEAKSVRFDDLQVLDLTVAAPVDTTPPSAPGTLSASGTTQTQTTLSWGAATDNVAVAGYQVTRDGALVPGTVSGLSWTDTGLAPGSTHTYSVRAVDTAGLTGASSNVVSVTTDTPPVDTTPPSAPGTLSASGTTQTQTTLSWGAATDNVEVAGYQVTRDGALVPGTVSGLSWTDTGLAPGSTHTYSVRAVDTAGLTGASSNVVSVTTQSTPSGLFSDTFTGADGSPWASAWATTATGGSVTINADAGRLNVDNTGGAFARAQLSGPAATADVDLVFSYRWNSGNRRAYFSAFTRGSGGWTNPYRPVNGYGLEFSSDSSTVTIKRDVNGAVTNLASTSGAQQVGSAKQWVRLRVKGTTIQYRTWVDGTTEPTTWRATVTDSTVTAPGQTYLSLVRSGSSTEVKYVDIDDLAAPRELSSTRAGAQDRRRTAPPHHAARGRRPVRRAGSTARALFEEPDDLVVARQLGCHVGVVLAARLVEGHEAEDRGAHQQLLPVGAGEGGRCELVDQRGVGVPPQQRVDHHDGVGVRSRPPVGRQVDHRRGEPIGEQHVAGQVAVHELGRQVDGISQRVQACQQCDGPWPHLDLGSIPGDAVGDGPAVRASVEVSRVRFTRDRRVERAAGCHHLGPPASRFRDAVDVLDGGPPLDGPSTVGRRDRGREPESVADDASGKPGEPRDLAGVGVRLEHQVAGAHARPLTALQLDDGFVGDAESGEHLRRHDRLVAAHVSR